MTFNCPNCEEKLSCADDWLTKGKTYKWTCVFCEVEITLSTDREIFCTNRRTPRAKNKKDSCQRCGYVDYLTYFKKETLCRECLLGEDEPPEQKTGFSMIAECEILGPRYIDIKI
jgi:hypothetical protein